MLWATLAIQNQKKDSWDATETWDVRVSTLPHQPNKPQRIHCQVPQRKVPVHVLTNIILGRWFKWCARPEYTYINTCIYSIYSAFWSHRHRVVSHNGKKRYNPHPPRIAPCLHYSVVYVRHVQINKNP